MKSTYILILLLLCISCSSSKSLQFSSKLLNFENCLLNEKKYEYIEIEIPKGSKKTKEENHGFCEYRFEYQNKSTIYISTDIYSGSRLNYENLYSIGIDTYAISRSETLMDTIKNSGTNKNKLYWLEFVLGDVVVGFVDVPEEQKEEFEKAILSLNKK
jgi:hypothetical protein